MFPAHFFIIHNRIHPNPVYHPSVVSLLFLVLPTTNIVHGAALNLCHCSNGVNAASGLTWLRRFATELINSRIIVPVAVLFREQDWTVRSYQVWVCSLSWTPGCSCLDSRMFDWTKATLPLKRPYCLTTYVHSKIVHLVGLDVRWL
jgi:hypothetical protein